MRLTAAVFRLAVAARRVVVLRVVVEVVRRGVVLAVEAVEGTDACIARGGSIGKGAVVVKARKPQQDDRFDAPAVGPKTIATLAAAGCSVLAVEAELTLVIDRETMVEAADAAKIAFEGIQ